MAEHRLLFYSHDTFGLGHLRRCLKIAEFITSHYADTRVLIVSGSPLAHRLPSLPYVDVISLPHVRKQQDGSYAAEGHALSLQETIQLRQSLLLDIYRTLQPSLVLVDKEPRGLLGELTPVIELAASEKCPLILGLRDVLDAPDVLAKEWQEKDALSVLPQYQEIWIYGTEDFYNPLQGLDLPASVHQAVTYTGFLPSRLPQIRNPLQPAPLVVTAGGGGDGGPLFSHVLDAYRSANAPALPPCLFILGPFLDPAQQQDLQQQASGLEKVSCTVFHQGIESLYTQAAATLSLCGYNTFCEILSFGKPAAVLPRSHPRAEQAIRAERAAVLGLLECLPEPEDLSPTDLCETILRLIAKPPLPTQETLLTGKHIITQRLKRYLI